MYDKQAHAACHPVPGLEHERLSWAFRFRCSRTVKQAWVTKRETYKGGVYQHHSGTMAH